MNVPCSGSGINARSPVMCTERGRGERENRSSRVFLLPNGGFEYLYRRVPIEANVINDESDSVLKFGHVAHHSKCIETVDQRERELAEHVVDIVILPRREDERREEIREATVILRSFAVRSTASTMDRIEFVLWKGVRHVIVVGELEHFSCLLAVLHAFRTRKVEVVLVALFIGDASQIQLIEPWGRLLRVGTSENK